MWASAGLLRAEMGAASTAAARAAAVSSPLARRFGASWTSFVAFGTEAAADPLLACVLVGMGITSLSMASAAVRPVGARLASASMDTLEDAAEAALAASDPMAARDAVRRVLGS